MLLSGGDRRPQSVDSKHSVCGSSTTEDFKTCHLRAEHNTACAGQGGLTCAGGHEPSLVFIGRRLQLIKTH